MRAVKTFLHIHCSSWEMVTPCAGGERVTYEAEWDDRKGKYRASTWTVDASGAGAAMLPGVLKKYFTDKGFGFIEPQDGSEDLFAHQRQFSGDPNSIQDGMKVKYEVEWDGKKGKNKAGPDLGVLTMVSAAAAAMAVVAAVAAAAMACSSQIMANPWVAAHSMGPLSRAATAPWAAHRGPIRATLPTGSLSPVTEDLRLEACHPAGNLHKTLPETSWTPPAAPAAPPPAPAMPSLPPGWESAQDPASGKTYYFNRATNATWNEIPRAVGEKQDQGLR
ncbi:unnamed protein product [Durusdinium trenchii]|uniref:WW domain-containing protein n=1 Tax=Durusdinium trenchii TaxID=1381693 RepID=A0ABP0QAQ3_9DINO